MTKIFTRIASAIAALLASSPAAAIAAEPAIIALPLQPIVPADLRGCTAHTASGLGYESLRTGTGPKPGKGDFVLINYIGYLPGTGAVFDQNQKSALNLDNVIPGFAEGLQLMPRGSVWRLCVPAAMGYGARGAGETIPPNSDLVFQIELIDSKTPAELDALRKAQAAGEPATPAAPPPAH